jgi:hypothetical protein
MTVRAKFVVNAITDQGQHAPKIVKLAPQYDMSIPEDRRFQKATPWGEICLHIDNPAAVDQLKIGKGYYIDMTPAEEPQAV